MEAGFETFTADGSGAVQIDSQFKNLEFKYKVPFSVANGQNISVSYSGGINPVIGVVVNGFITVNILSVSGSTYTWNISNVGLSQDFGTRTGFVYFFDEPYNTPTSSGFGMQVFNQEGRIVYDSANKYMRVLDYLNWGVNGVTKLYDGGVKVAVCPVGTSYGRAIYNSPLDPQNPNLYGEQISASYFRTPTDNQIDLRDGIIYNNPNNSGTRPSSITGGSGSALIIDVTGL